MNTGSVTTVTVMTLICTGFLRTTDAYVWRQPTNRAIGDAHITAACATSGVGRPHEPALEQLVDGATTV